MRGAAMRCTALGIESVAACPGSLLDKQPLAEWLIRSEQMSDC